MIKHNVNYFKKNESLMLFGGGILAVSVFCLWIASAIHAFFFYIIAPPCIVAGFVLFLIGSSGRASESDIDAHIRKQTEIPEIDFADDIHYSKRVIKSNTPTFIEGYVFEDGVMIKKAKNASLRSSLYSKALVYIMTDRLYIDKKTASLISEDVDKTTDEILYSDIKNVELEEVKKDIAFGKKIFKTKSMLFKVTYGEDKVFTCPIFDNMDSVHFVEKINKTIAEWKKTQA